MKKQNTNKNNYNWEPAYSIKRKGNYKYTVNKKVEKDSSVKIVTAMLCILMILILLTTLYYFLKDNEIMKSLMEISDSYIFIGLTTFIVFLVFKNRKKEYNNSKKGVK